jgi:hypothetical protein
MAVNAELYVQSVEEFALISSEILRQSVMYCDLKGTFKFPASIRCCHLLLHSDMLRAASAC